MIEKFVLILDLDGVLITTSLWKADEIDDDGYSKFNEVCVGNLNKFLIDLDCEIWLSSSRRRLKTLAEFNEIFERREIVKSVTGFLPFYPNCSNRKEEIVQFIHEHDVMNFLIIDDDKSLNELIEYQENLILTEQHKGFDAEKLKQAIIKLTTIKSNKINRT